MKESFLPEGYEAPVSAGGYMKIQDGDNVFRILSSAIVGYEYWNSENKPIRSKTPFETTPNIKINPDGKPQKVKHFWAFVVWNYNTRAVEILEVTQSTIQSAITNLVKDEDWGDPKGYDIKINRSGQNIETEYSVNPKPHKEVEADILTAYQDKKIDLEKLYTGENPFE